MTNIEIYLEIGKKRTFAGALAWPGWCRSGRDTASALQALVAYGPRYARLLATTPLTFRAPTDTAAFVIIEQLAGTATTDFGAPDGVPTQDRQPLAATELQRMELLLAAYWHAFDMAVQAATGKALRKGPRGGGRDLAAIMDHVLAADTSYLARLAWKVAPSAGATIDVQLRDVRQAVLRALNAAAYNGLPERGPRGGSIWMPRYFVRRVAWHVLEHLWEIEDRMVG